MSDQYTNPKSWGPHFWFILRCIANNYSDNPTKDEMTHVRTFIIELQYILPCEVCKYTFRQHYNRNPLDKYLGNKDKLMEWVEIIYQETKKVIQDKRIKIIDSFEEAPEIALPMRTVYKSKTFDPISARLDEIRKKAAEQKKIESKINNNNQVSTNMQTEAQNIANASKPITQIVKMELPKPIIQLPESINPIEQPSLLQTLSPDPMLHLVSYPKQTHHQPKPLIQNPEPQVQPPKPLIQIQKPNPIVQQPNPIVQQPKPSVQQQKQDKKEQTKHVKKDRKIDMSSSSESSKVPFTIPKKLANINTKPVNIDIPKNTSVKKDKKNDVTAQSLPTTKDKSIVSRSYARQSIPKTHIASKIHAPPLVVTKRCKKCDDKAAL